MSLAISVIVPTYNRASLIGATLESILDQSHAPAEVIVADDGSTDETESIVRGFSQKVQYHRIENSGVCAARSLGVSVSKSPWIAFCDSDDLWERDKLERQVLLHERSGVEFSFTNFRIFSGGEWEKETKFDSAPAGFFEDFKATPEGLVLSRAFYDDLLHFQPVYPSTVLMSRQFYERVGGFKSEIGRIQSEDLEFMLRCAQHWPIGAIVEPAVGIRKHESNFSGDTYRRICGEIEILRYALQTHSPGQKTRELISEQITQRSIQAGWWAFERADFGSFTSLLSGAPRAQLDTTTRVKLFIASCPGPIAKMFHTAVTNNNAFWRR
jgi:glycosyltransferase involved in cell wall biosynthesis